MRILGGIIAILVAIWFYRTAESKGAEPFSWAIAGTIFYYLPMGLWTYVVNPMIKNPHITSEGSSIIARLAPTLVGVVVVVLLRQFVLLKVKSGQSDNAG
ncbi:hypothetical protein [Methylogaea oryzae]|uniref:Uncharacterized protein n=1 Tax=Methylogaea oryzae TaxID=1295382 RepID=A0A8D5ALS6_9GAMM|nr:hypothetical protein [Methylogaea oryzae]BBL72436.1 hypothetical protein MoryE10_30420 [Methylogaea oryzae]